jgi:hypothetical protein
MRRSARIAFALVVTLASLAPLRLGAQARTVERHGFDEQEGRLMAFYSSALAFTPVGAPTGVEAWVVDVGVEGSYVPWLSTAQRRVGSDKPEATNLIPFVPRVRLAVALPEGFRVEAGWVPPVRAFGVKSNLIGLALSRPTAVTPSFAVTARLSALAGYARAAITCYEDLGRGDPSQQIYYSNVCYGGESDDRFEPRHLSGELVATYGRGWRVVPYAGAGVRAERTRFDVGVITREGTRDADNPILELRTARGYGFAGATWLGGAARLSGELYYAPGSLVTARLLAGLRLRER